jgi:hypothetical protein
MVWIVQFQLLEAVENGDKTNILVVFDIGRLNKWKEE